MNGGASLPVRSCTHAETDHFQWFQGSFFKLQTLFFNENSKERLPCDLETHFSCEAATPTARLELNKPNWLLQLCQHLLALLLYIRQKKPFSPLFRDWSIYNSTYPLQGYILVCSLLLLVLATAAHSAWNAMKTAGKIPLLCRSLTTNCFLEFFSQTREEPLLSHQIVERRVSLLDFPADMLAGASCNHRWVEFCTLGISDVNRRC